jgi:hypothetical protein
MYNKKRVSHTWIYTFARGVGWTTFAVHVISIGQSSLLNQMLSVALLICSTLLTIYNVGNDEIVGNRLIIKRTGALATHKDAYLYLQPTDEEERVLRHYLRLPYKPEKDGKMISKWNSDWWREWDARFSE